MKTLRKLRALFRRSQLEREMAEEMRLHLELQAEKNAAGGMEAQEARYAARRQFGGVEQIKEQCRDQRGSVWFEQSIKDLRFAIRSLAKAPGFTLAIVATLAIGVGATTAMMAIGRTILFSHAPFPESERMVVVTDPDVRDPFARVPLPFFAYPHRFAALDASVRSYEALGTLRDGFLNLVISGEPTGVTVGWVSDGFFRALRATPYLGRIFSGDDFKAEQMNVAVLSWRTWSTQFGADRDIIGKEIQLGERSRRVIGVLGKDFKPPTYFDAEQSIFLPEVHSPTPTFDTFRWMRVIGRLREGVSVGMARAELSALTFPGEPAYPPRERAKHIVRVVPLEEYYPASLPRLYWLFLAAVGCLFAIACANAANLLLARTVGRSRELGVRLALGGGRWRLVCLLLSETLVLALLANAAGLFIAWGSCAAMTPLLLPNSADLAIEPATLAFATGLSLFACVVATAIPAWRVWRAPLNDMLKEGFGSLGNSRRLGRVRKGLVIAQAALAVALTIGTVLMTRSFWRLYRTDLGFQTENRLAIQGVLPEGIPEKAFLPLAERVRDKLTTLPGVKRVTTASVVPFSGATQTSIVAIDGRAEAGATFWFGTSSVSPEYFATLGLPMFSGRGFEGLRPGGPLVTVINRSAAQRYFPNADPIGQRIDGGHGKLEIIGVVGDVKERARKEEVRPQMYVPFWQPPIYTQLVTELVHLEGRATASFEALVRRAAYGVDPRMVVRITRLTDSAADSSKSERNAMNLLLVLGALALALAAFGLAAVMAYAVAQRRREFGIRLALGAEPAMLQRLVLREGTLLAATGVALGAVAAWSATPLLNALLFETSARDPLTFVVGPAVIGLVALLACWLPARRAAKVDPMVALRCE